MPNGLLLLLTFGLLSFSGVLAGQSASRTKTSKQEVNTVNRAEQLRYENPEAAIKMLSTVLSSKSASPTDLIASYTLLGDIYSDIDQYELAIDRYDSALNFNVRSVPAEVKAGLNRRMGDANRALGKSEEARSAYNLCLNLVGPNAKIAQECKEGLADLEAGLRNFDLSQSYYDDVESNNRGDSALQVRVNSKRADVYLQQGDYGNSNRSLAEAINTIPRDNKLTVKETDELLIRNVRVREKIARESPALDTVSLVVAGSKLNSVAATDAFARFEAQKSFGNTSEATRQLRLTLDNLDTTVSPRIAADIYETAADHFLTVGETNLGIETYRKFTSVNEAKLEESREVLRQQVAILKAQQGIDLEEKDELAAEVESQYSTQREKLQGWLIWLLILLLSGALLSVFLILRNVKKRQRANQELLLRNLQTRMNPHFIFNSLNSINNYIAKQDERSANRYLGRFAKLMRKVLDQSGQDFIPLSEEIEQLNLYLELEKERFAGQFIYRIVVINKDGFDAAVDVDAIQIPPMLLQPYVENAIWHGLRYRPDGGELTITVDPGATTTSIIIMDNGVGRANSAALKTKNQLDRRGKGSQGMDITNRRIELINLHYRRNIQVNVEDAFDHKDYPGTKVTLQVS